MELWKVHSSILIFIGSPHPPQLLAWLWLLEASRVVVGEGGGPGGTLCLPGLGATQFGGFPPVKAAGVCGESTSVERQYS